MNSRVSEVAARFFTNPQLNGWGFIIGVLGFVFAIYTYWASLSFPNLMAQVHSPRTILVSSEGAQDLLIYADKKLIKGPVTSAQIAIWNAGTKPIKAEDVLEKIQIKASDGAPLLSVRIIKTTRKVNKIVISSLRAAEGIIDFDFQVLEKGDGALLQVTYEGTDKIKFIGSGVIVGQNNFEIINSAVNSPEKERSETNHTFSKLILFFMLLGMLFFFLRMTRVIYIDLSGLYKDGKTGVMSIKFAINIIGNLIGVALLICIIIGSLLVFKELIAENSPFL
jgi:hypothetical protein